MKLKIGITPGMNVKTVDINGKGLVPPAGGKDI